MPPDEVHALRSYRRTAAWVFRGGAALLVAIAVGTVAVALGAQDRREHFLGQSVHTQATVVGVDAGGLCGRSAQREHHYTLTWDEGGASRQETITRCGSGEYDVGERVEIWSTSGMPYTESALVWRLLVGGIALVFVLLGAGALWQERRLRRDVDAVLGGAQPATSYAVADLSRWWLPFHRTVYPKGASGPHPPPGTVYPLRLGRRGRPRGLTLHVAPDGARRWYST